MPLKVLNPLKYTTSFTDYLTRDITFVRKSVVGFETDKDTYSEITGVKTDDRQTLRFNKYVIAAGCGSVQIGETLGLRIPLLPMKGLSINVYHKGEGMKDTLIDASK